MESEALTTTSEAGNSSPKLKLEGEGTMENDGVVLIPKPSDDPRDPLVYINFNHSDSKSTCTGC
jgi:hypothetical protein